MSDDYKIIQLEELTADNPIFKSNGISYVKVTRNGDIEAKAIPIKSTGVSDAIDAFAREKPTPPIKRVVVKPKDPAFKELGLSKKQHIQTYDLTNKKYLEEMEEYNSELGMKIVLMGLDIDIKETAGGEVVEDESRKIEILRGMGMTGEQFTQIVTDITDLTKWEAKKEEDFLD